MSASKVLDLAERQGLLEPKVISELRQQVADSKFVVTPEAIAKVLVDHGHLTAFQARRLISTALAEPAPGGPAAAPPVPAPAAAPPAKPREKRRSLLHREISATNRMSWAWPATQRRTISRGPGLLHWGLLHWGLPCRSKKTTWS